VKRENLVLSNQLIKVTLPPQKANFPKLSWWPVIQPLSNDLIKPTFHLEQFIAHQSIRETTQMDT